jgi:hypothetical protein
MVREALNSRVIEFDVQGELVVVRPVRSVAGGLAAYARKPGPLTEVRDTVWKEVARGKAHSRSA